MSRAAFAAAISPTGDQIRGIREVFYNEKPFCDNRNPTKTEVDEWHRMAINHVRSLVGYTTEDRKVKKDHCMVKRAYWGQERRFTTIWDEKYMEKILPYVQNGQGSSRLAFILSLNQKLDNQTPVCLAILRWIHKKIGTQRTLRQLIIV